VEHRLLVRQIVLGQPTAVLESNADGGFVTPPRADSPDANAFRNLRVIVKSLTATGGTFRLLAPGGGDLLTLNGITLGGRLEQAGGSWKGSGQFSAKGLVLGPFPVANLQGGYDFADGTYKFTKLIGTTCHGQLAGGFQLATRAAGAPGDFQIQGSALDVNELLKSAFSRPDLLSASLDFNATGRKTGLAWTAHGSLDAHDGQLIHIDFVDELAAALGLKELSQPDFATAHVDFSLDQDVVTLSGLDLKGAAFELTGSGTLALADGTAKLDLQITILPDAAKEIAPAIAAHLGSGDGGAKTLSFSITGPLDHLKTAPPVHF
jgi:hypothetical protein